MCGNNNVHIFFDRLKVQCILSYIYCFNRLVHVNHKFEISQYFVTAATVCTLEKFQGKSSVETFDPNKSKLSQSLFCRTYFRDQIFDLREEINFIRMLHFVILAVLLNR